MDLSMQPCGNLADWAVEQNRQMVGHAVIVAP